MKMMIKTERLVVRVEQSTKDETEAIYGRLGLTLAQAVNVFLHQSVEQGGLPFDLKLSKQSESK
ncbi:MAG: type II toxin-antitoxin system RelB/DinJ family antitoxin [Acidaminococcaceae bacterium]